MPTAQEKVRLMVQLANLFNKMYTLGWNVSSAGSLDAHNGRDVIVFK